MVIKMVALGIFGQKCYLGDTWNRLDFFIVMAGSVPAHPLSWEQEDPREPNLPGRFGRENPRDLIFFILTPKARWVWGWAVNTRQGCGGFGAIL